MHLPKPCLDCNRLTDGASRCRECAAKKKKIWNEKSAKKRKMLASAAASAENGGGHRRRRAAVNRNGGDNCSGCSKWFPAGQIRIDHKVPLSKGGGDTDNDVQSLCLWCHNTKTALEARSRRK